MKKVCEAPDSPNERALAFMEDYCTSPDGSPIDICIGRMTNDAKIAPELGDPCVLIRINSKVHGFTVLEARALARAAEATMNFGGFVEAGLNFPDLVMGLYHAADVAEQMDNQTRQ